MICQVQVINDKHRFVYASPATEDVIGWSVEEILNMSPDQIYTSESMAIIADDVESLLGGSPASTVVVEAIRKDGTHIWLENKVRVLDAHEGAISVIICTRDVTERKRLEDQLAELALIDGLTGISNRRAFDQAIEREWKRTLRTGTPLSLLLIDVDNFKLFNDAYGHQVGDDCLRAIAGALRRTVRRPGDMVARYGGEEFTVLLPSADLPGATFVAEQLCKAIADLKIPHNGNLGAGCVVTISCGASTALARVGGTIRMPEALLQAADTALYKAKSTGKNCVAISLVLARSDSSHSAQ